MCCGAVVSPVAADRRGGDHLTATAVLYSAVALLPAADAAALLPCIIRGLHQQLSSSTSGQ
jgi:hypothetical protein